MWPKAKGQDEEEQGEEEEKEKDGGGGWNRSPAVESYLWLAMRMHTHCTQSKRHASMVVVARHYHHAASLHHTHKHTPSAALATNVSLGSVPCEGEPIVQGAAHVLE